MAGRHAAEVLLKPTLTDGFQPPPVRVEVKYELLPDVQPDTPSLLLGAGRVGGVLTGTVTLNSLSGHPVRVAKWSVEPSDSRTVVEPVAGGLGGSKMFTVRQSVAATGDGSSRVSFVVGGDGGETTTTVEIRYYGLAD